MEQNFQGQQWPNNNQKNPQPIGTGEGEVPLVDPSSSKIDLRTMSSDMSSIKEMGGNVPRPYTPPPSIPNVEPKKVEPPKNIPQQNQATFSVNQTFPTQTQNTQQATPIKKQKGSGLFIAILVIIVLAGLAAVGYFFVYPKFASEPVVDVTEEEVVAINENIPQEEEIVPLVPIATTTTSTQEMEIVPESNIPVNEIHSSFLKTTSDLVLDSKLASFGINDLKQTIEFTSTTLPLFKEIIWKNENNKPITFGYVSELFAPDFFTKEFTDKFESDFTAFAYTNTKGTWLGFISKLKDGVQLGQVQDSMSALQRSPSLSNFFLVDPGIINPWKDGKVNKKPTSLADFSLSGATISYTWFDTYLLVSTNLDGASEAAKRLGY